MSAFDARIRRRTFIKTAAVAAGASLFHRRPLEAATPGGDTLYNGIRLADPWPPRRIGFQQLPVRPPYLVDRPAVVPIDLGRQLFVDDFLIEATSLQRTFHRPVYHPASPVLRPTTQWERYDEYAERTQTRSNPAAMTFSDGVFYDPYDRVFKMWYMGGYSQNVCLALSDDGVSWRRPTLDVVAGTNITLSSYRDSSTVWLDHSDPDRKRRYKLAFWYDGYLRLWVSADGVHWTEAGRGGRCGDRTTFFHNPFRDVWVFSIRDAAPTGAGRFRRYMESEAFEQAAQWEEHQPVEWAAADALDPQRPEFSVAPELYNLDCVAYESVLLGLFTIFRGEHLDREKPNDVCVGFSRDGFHWHRPDRRAFLGVSEQVGDWNWANVQSAGGGCLVVGDQLYFYVSGRRGVPGSTAPGICSTGLATLRRDGFASMDRPRAGDVERLDPLAPPGSLITRPVRFSGRYLFVNADTMDGELRVDVLDREGRPIGGFSAAECVPVRGDSTRARVRWTEDRDLAPVAGEPVRFRFTLTAGRIYAFWVSGTERGESGGYVGAGGPGFRTAVDVAT